MTALLAASQPSSVRLRRRYINRRTPASLTLIAAAVLAWAALAFSTYAWSPMWDLMVVAMMWPLWNRPVDRTWRSTFPRWRIAGCALLVASATTMWLLFGMAGHYVLAVTVPSDVTSMWTSGWLLVALVLMRSSTRRVLLGKCHRQHVVAPKGRRAVFTSVRQGWWTWWRCALLCGPVMVSMLGSHDLTVMIGGTATVWWEQRYPRRWKDRIPVIMLAVTLAMSLADGVAMGSSGGMHHHG